MEPWTIAQSGLLNDSPAQAGINKGHQTAAISSRLNGQSQARINDQRFLVNVFLVYRQSAG
jgi:hypothetical protein